MASGLIYILLINIDILSYFECPESYLHIAANGWGIDYADYRSWK